MSNEDRHIRLSVHSIGWTQGAIAGSFQEGRDLRNQINSLRRLPLEQRITLVSQFPPIRVVEFESQGWITLDNRGLYLLRQILDLGSEITARIAATQEAQELRRKLTTDSEGTTIVIRANRRLCQ